MNVGEVQPAAEQNRESATDEPSNLGASKYNSYLSNLERDNNLADADILEQGAAFMMSYRKLNGAVNLYDWLEFDSRAKFEEIFQKEDKEFTQNWDEEAIQLYSEENGFGSKEYPRLAKANSQASLASITNGINQQLDYDAYINQNLSQGWQTAGMIIGTGLDLDVAFPAAKVSKAKRVFDVAKAARATKASDATVTGAKTEVALYSAWETAHAQVSDDYTAADAVMGVGAASLFSFAVTKYQMGKQNRIIEEYSNTHGKGEPEVPITKSNEPNGAEFNAQTPVPKNKTPENVVEDYLQKYKWSDEKLSATKVGDDIQLKNYEDADDGVFNSQMSDMLNEVMLVPRKSIDNMVEEVIDLVTAAKIDGVDANSVGVVKEVNELMKMVRVASKDTALQLEDVVGIKFNKNKDGSYSMKTPSGKKFGKAVPATLAVALTGTAANASEDDIAFSTVGAVIMALGIAGVVGSSAYKAWAKSDGRLSSTITKAKASIAKSKQSVDVATSNPIVKNIREDGQLLRTKLTETYQRFADFGGVAKDMANKLLVNFADGTVQSAEIMKRRFARIAEAAVARVENAEFKNWLEAQGMKHQPIVNFLENNEMLNKFREEITDALDGGVGGVDISPQAQKVATEFKTQMRGIYDELVAANVKGYRETALKDGTVIPAIKYTEDYVPRYWRTSGMRQLMGNKANSEALLESIVPMVHSAAVKRFNKKMEAWNKVGDLDAPKPKEPTDISSRKTAHNLLRYADGEEVGKKSRVNDDSIARLEQQFEAEGIEMSSDMRKQLELESDKTSRAMYRVELDYTAFKPFKAVVDGEEVDIGLSALMDRDSHSVMARYANEQSGMIALGKADYPTVHAARTEVSKIDNIELREDMNMVIDSLAGEDLVNMTARQKQRYEVMTGVAFTVKLPLVTVSMLTEYAKILTTKSGFHSLMNQITEGIFNTYPKQSMLMDEISRATGQATASLRHEINLKGLEDFSNISEASESAFTGGFGKVANIVRQGKEASSRYYGLLRFSDFLQKHASATNTQVLGEMIHNGRKMSPYRMQQYGITQDILDDFKSSGLINIGEGGWVSKLEYEKFTPAQKDNYNNIVFRMNQNLTQETTLGGTALYMHNDPLAKSLSYLLTFPAEAFANHGIRDLTTMDNEAFRSMFAMYLGGYMSLKLRYALDSKDVSDEEVAYRALIGMPIFGAIGTATGITDPVVLSFFNNMAELVNLSRYEDVVVGD